MKKVLFILVFFVLAITIVSAEETCEVLSGNVKDIGTEIACGSEHFYVIENDGTNIKMLSKYNLYVGLEINQVGPTYDNLWEAKAYCDSLTGYDATAVWPSLSEPGKYYCHTEKKLEYNDVKQNSEAVGLTIKDGKYVIRQVGIVYMSDQYIDQTHYDSDQLDDEGNVDLRYTEIQEYLDSYKLFLKNNGYEIKNIELIKLGGFNNLIKKVSGKDLDLGLDSYFINLDTNTIWEQIGEYAELEAIHLNIKDYIPNKYSWIDSTTYWLGSSLVDNRYNEIYDIFMTTLGDLCAVNRGCSGFTKFGAGIRPVLTIPNKDISFRIKTKTDGHGTIKSSKRTSKGGEEISFEIIPNKGYVLSLVKVTDSEGNKVTFTDNKFTMPNDNVLIEATFEIENPLTSMFLPSSLIVLFLIAFAFFVKTLIRIRRIS